jgi:hypothetical protein
MVKGDHLKEVDAFIDEPWRDYFCLPDAAGAKVAA